MELVPGSRPLIGDVPVLLRKRLLIVAAIFAFGGALGAAMPLLVEPPTGRVVFFASLGQLLVVSAAALVGLIKAGQTLSLRALRGIELVLFSSLLLGYVMLIGMDQGEGALEWCARLGGFGMSLGARFVGLPWFCAIVMYGVFIPNTWHRCATIVGIMALTPLAIHAAIGLADDALEKRLLLIFLLEMGLWMVIGAAIAIFGSHHIARLREEVSSARKLGQYQLKQRLGSGGMGEVYLAEHLLLRRPCAIKLIRPERAGDPNTLRRFEREVQTTATLTHPNTVQIFDYGHAEDGTFYYVMEYLPGLSLEQLVNRNGPLPPERTVHFLQQVCGALREAHAIGLIHRDIKPSNILICERGGLHDAAKLLDFGLVLEQGISEGEEKLTLEGAIAGTPAYMSPEQAGGQENLDPRSDIYSLGAVAYFLLTGQPPFADRSPMKMIAAHIYEPPSPLSNHRPDISEDLQVVVLCCLAKVPADRFPNVESLEIALAGCHTAGQWSEQQAANWWRSQAAPSRTVGGGLI